MSFRPYAIDRDGLNGSRDATLKEARESVSKGLDAEFGKRVETEALSRLDAMKASVWSDYVAQKARALATGLRKAVGDLQGAWRFICDRCGRRITLQVGP